MRFLACSCREQYLGSATKSNLDYNGTQPILEDWTGYLLTVAKQLTSNVCVFFMLLEV
jgi:hypothetical protein